VEEGVLGSPQDSKAVLSVFSDLPCTLICLTYTA
jgi:hypothetical protein